jgi:hypothetical protein
MATAESPTNTQTSNHLVVELLDGAGEISTSADEKLGVVEKVYTYGGKAMRVISLPLAFRKYSWLNLAPIKNVSNNLRGIVVNARARAVYEVALDAEKAGEKLGTYAKFVGGFSAIVLSLRSVYDETLEICHSQDDTPTKGAKLGAQMSSFGLRTITGILVLPETHMVLHGIAAASGYGMKNLPGHRATLELVKDIAEQSDADISAKFQAFTDGKNIYNYIQATVNPVVNRMMGM